MLGVLKMSIATLEGELAKIERAKSVEAAPEPDPMPSE